MSWMQTFTGMRFTPTDPKWEDIRIMDIAHALSNMCRFAGHCKQFYSVAQHCVEVSFLIEKTGGTIEDQRRGLFHDASEAYLVDIPTPVKRQEFMREYRSYEKILEDAVAMRFGIPTPLVNAVVKCADGIMLVTEARDLMGVDAQAEWQEFGYANTAPRAEPILPWHPQDAKKIFLNRYIALAEKV